MNQQQEQHLEDLLLEVTQLLSDKYAKGAKEHGGDLLTLTPRQLIDEAISECIDQMVYLLTLKGKLR